MFVAYLRTFERHGAEGDSDARRHRPDRRRSQPRVHHSGRRPAKARCSATRIISIFAERSWRGCRDFDDDVESIAASSKWTTLYAATDEMHDEAALGARFRSGNRFRRAASRSATSSTSAPSIQSRWAPKCRGRTARKHFGVIWAPTASARRASSRRSSRRATTRPASSGRRASHRSMWASST
jgi:hypothetical protein